MMDADCCSGGEEVLLDVGGQDATEAFEDVGHSDEARELLNGMLVGNLKRMVRLLPFPYTPIIANTQQNGRRKDNTNVFSLPARRPSPQHRQRLFLLGLLGLQLLRHGCRSVRGSGGRWCHCLRGVSVFAECECGGAAAVASNCG